MGSLVKLAACALAVAAVVAGCGLESTAGTGGATIEVTHAFGSEPIATKVQRSPPSGETVAGLLERSFQVRTASKGRVVESIQGASATPGGLRWSYWINGIAPAKSIRSTGVNRGDRIWWDLHDAVATALIPAVVGSYPEPFTTGIGGRRFPTVLDCASDVQAACNTVARALRRAGVKVAYQLLGGGSGSDSLAVVVGTLRDLRGLIATELLAGGPSLSGVFAQIIGSGANMLALDNPLGQVVRTVGGGAGLIAATEQPGLNEPAWLITGTDVAGVRAAAAALTPAKLHDHLALAIVHGDDLPLPLEPAR